MIDAALPEPVWVRRFIATLGQTANVNQSIRASQASKGSVYRWRNKHPAFASEWERVLRESRQRAGALAAPESADEVATAPACDPATRPSRNWRTVFFDALAETSNVSAAAARANITSGTAYRLRREDPGFAARWLTALREGYDNLEMEVVGYLRSADPRRKMDVTSALRLLAAHRETVERQRSLIEEEDEQSTVEALDAFFEGLRQRRLANEALLAKPDNEDEDR